MERIVVDQERLTIPGHTLGRNQAHSSVTWQSTSFLCDFPCNIVTPYSGALCAMLILRTSAASVQESHVKNCLDGGSGTTPQAAKYLVYKLPVESALIGLECVICLEEFAKGMLRAIRHECISYNFLQVHSCPPKLLV